MVEMEREGDAVATAPVVLDALVDDEDVGWGVAVVVCLFGCWVEGWMEGPCWRKAEMKEERKKGRWEGILGSGPDDRQVPWYIRVSSGIQARSQVAAVGGLVGLS